MLSHRDACPKKKKMIWLLFFTSSMTAFRSIDEPVGIIKLYLQLLDTHNGL